MMTTQRTIRQHATRPTTGRWTAGMLGAFSLAGLLMLGAARSEAADATAGKAVYTKSCGACHGPAGEAKPAIEKMNKVTMRHLGSKEVQAKKDAELRKDVVEGFGKMKPVKGLSDAQIADMIAHMRTFKQ